MKAYIAAMLTLVVLGTTWARAVESSDPSLERAVFYVA
jgi:hypothetical protein